MDLPTYGLKHWPESYFHIQWNNCLQCREAYAKPKGVGYMGIGVDHIHFADEDTTECKHCIRNKTEKERWENYKKEKGIE